MSPRQVRLDDDVAALVEEYQEAEGLKSLSASANRMLRLAAGPEEEPAPEPAPAPKPVDTTVTVPRPRRRRSSFPPTTPPPLGSRRPPDPKGQVRGRGPAPTVAPPRATGCKAGNHPILARRGDRCGACGATL